MSHTGTQRILCSVPRQNYTSEVYSLPLLTAPVAPQLFVLPEHAEFLPLLPCDVETIFKMQVRMRRPLRFVLALRPFA